MEITDPKSPNQESWAKRYVDRLIGVGVDESTAVQIFSAGDHDYDADPVEAADEEMSYWDNDGDDGDNP